MPNGKNLLLITMDELHIEALSCYGATSHKTPNIDRLAECSNWYTYAHTASPLCLPSRISIATGLYPHTSRSVSNGFGRSMGKELDSLFTVLKRNGYRNLYSGKCHFVPVPYGDILKKATREYGHFKNYYYSLGIDELYLQDGNALSAYFYDDYARELDEIGLLPEYRALCGDKSIQNIFDFPGPDHMFVDTRIADKGIEMMMDSEESKQFLWVSFSGPHYPMNVPKSYHKYVDMDKAMPRRIMEGEWDDKSKFHHRSYHGPGLTEGSGFITDGAQKNYDENFWRKWRSSYFANVALLDEQIGKVLDAADKKWGANYACVLTADHGDMAGNHPLWGKNHSLYEDVLRVPLMVRDAGQKDGVVSNEPVSTVDIFPTCMEMLGLPQLPCDGVSLFNPDCKKEILLSEAENILSIIKGRYKLTVSCYENIGTFTELYDLKDDPYEFVNLASDPGNKDLLGSMNECFEHVSRGHNLDSTVFYTREKRPYWF